MAIPELDNLISLLKELETQKIPLTFPMTRKNTNKILDLLDQGVIASNKLARDLLGYLSEDDVTDFCHKNDLDFDESDDD